MTSAELAAEGWKPIDPYRVGYFPPRDRIVEFVREGNHTLYPPWFGRWCDMPPEFNVAGLWWREA